MSESKKDISRVEGVFPTHNKLVGELTEFYFGPEKQQSPWLRFCDRAYRDMNRTLRGLDVREMKTLRTYGNTLICDAIDDLAQRCREKRCDEASFDRWHRKLCHKLVTLYYDRMAIGQAQKWVNMALKYCAIWLSLTSPRDPLLCAWPYMHLPIDQRILRYLRNKDQAVLSENIYPGKAWSAIEDYKEYLRVQKNIRKAVRAEKGANRNTDYIAGMTSALDVDFIGWSRTKNEKRSKKRSGN